MLNICVLCLFIVCVYGAEKAPRMTQNDGSKIPVVGFGTGKIGAVYYQSVLDAIDAGYRHIDTSLNYEMGKSEKDVGRAIKEKIKAGVIKREDIYVVSKLESWDHARDRVPIGINQSLTNLGLEYLDLYLIHSPNKSVDVRETWAGMEDVLKWGLTKSIGVSNFDETLLDQVLQNATVKPVTNQVLCHPYHNQKNLQQYLIRHNITLSAYSPLGGTAGAEKLLSDPKLVSIGKAHNVSSAQVTLRYLLQRNTIVIPTSTHKQYIIEDIDLFNFKLTDDDMNAIDSLNKN